MNNNQNPYYSENTSADNIEAPAPNSGCNYSSNVSIQSVSNAAEQPKLEYTKYECLFAAAAAIISFFLIRFTLFNTPGFVTTAMYAVLFTAVIIYSKAKSRKLTPFCKALAVVLYLFSTVFSITDNLFVKVLNIIFLFGATGYFIYSVSHESKKIDRFLPVSLLKSVFEYPFSKFSVLFRITGSCASNSKFNDKIKLVFLGLLLAFPLTAIVALLLTSADEGLNRILGSFFRAIFSDNIWVLFLQLIIAVPCTCYIFGMIYAGSYPSGLNDTNEERCNKLLSSARCIQNIILYSAVTPICILYVMFFISQTSYFLSAFTGNLPYGYSYSDYARKGFFELLIVTVINLTVIILINLLAKNSGKDKPKLLKFYSTMISIFTLILIITAASKMIMYIYFYGLTQLRVYTTWFMLLCAAVFVLTIIKQFRYNFNISRWTAYIFTAMFALLCFSRPDSLIAKYNINMYNSGALEELDTDEILEMSDDALLTALNSGVIDEDDIIIERGIYKSGSNISSVILNSRLD